MRLTYRPSVLRRAFDRAMIALARRGMSPSFVSALTVRGRSSGELRTVPVTPVRVGGRWYLVAPYGPKSWVLNLRAAGAATLRRGRTEIPVECRELPPGDAIPVLRRYVARVPNVRPFMGVRPRSPEATFAEIAPRHPVFEITRGYPPSPSRDRSGA